MWVHTCGGQISLHNVGPQIKLRSSGLSEVLSECVFSHWHELPGIPRPTGIWWVGKTITHMDQAHERCQSFPMECLWTIDPCLHRLTTAIFFSWMFTAWDCSLMETLLQKLANPASCAIINTLRFYVAVVQIREPHLIPASLYVSVLSSSSDRVPGPNRFSECIPLNYLMLFFCPLAGTSFVLVWPLGNPGEELDLLGLAAKALMTKPMFIICFPEGHIS